MTNTLLLIAIGLLATLIILAILALNKLGSMNETWERTRDKLATMSSGLDKINTAVEWWLGREGLKLEYTNINWRWIVTKREDKPDSLASVWDNIKANRETIVYHLYQAHLRALQDFDQQKQEQTKTKRKKK